jgi:Flp pilus assembly protein TadD
LAQWKRRSPILLIVAAVLLTFWPVVTSEFTTWDDDVLIWTNRTFNPPTLHSLRVWWTTANDRMWNPAVETVRGLLALATTANRDPVTGTFLNPYLFHATNLFIHLGTTLIVYQILRLLRFARWPACAGALVFGIHPLQVEPVAWTSALKDVLCGVFAMGAIWMYLRSRGFRPAEEGDDPGLEIDGPRWCYWLAAVLFLFATFSKPTAAVLPLIVLALAYLRWERPPGRIWRDVLFWLMLAIPSMVVTRLAQPALPDNVAPLWQRPLVATDAAAFYLFKLVWPASLTIDYGRRPSVIYRHGWAYWTWIIPVGLALALWLLGKRGRTLTIGAIIFLIPVLPVLGLVSFDFQVSSTVADRYVYLSFLGVAICVAWAMQRLKKEGAIVIWVILATLAVRSWYQTWYWQNSMALFTHALELDPTSAAALVNLGVAYDGRGDIPTEISYLNRAIAFRPELPQAYLGLGVAMVKSGRWDLAADAYRRGFAVQPKRVGDEVIRLSGDYGKTMQPIEAKEYGKLAIELRPDSPKAHLDYGAALAEAGDRAGAIRELGKAVEQDPSDVVAQCNLATTLAADGKYDEAAAHYQAALRTDPKLKAAQQGLRNLQTLRVVHPTTESSVLQPS